MNALNDFELEVKIRLSEVIIDIVNQRTGEIRRLHVDVNKVNALIKIVEWLEEAEPDQIVRIGDDTYSSIDIFLGIKRKMPAVYADLDRFNELPSQ